MTDIVSSEKKIQVEESQYRSALSEAWAQKIGGSTNWLIDGVNVNTPAVSTNTSNISTNTGNISVLEGIQKKDYLSFGTTPVVSLTNQTQLINSLSETWTYSSNPISLTKGKRYLINLEGVSWPALETQYATVELRINSVDNRIAGGAAALVAQPYSEYSAFGTVNAFGSVAFTADIVADDVLHATYTGNYTVEIGFTMVDVSSYNDNFTFNLSVTEIFTDLWS